MASLTTAPPENSTNAQTDEITDEQLVFEKLILRGCFAPSVENVTSYHLIVCGLMRVLQGYCEHLTAETLQFEEVPDHDVQGKRKQCQVLLTALKDVKCPFNIKLPDLLEANIPVMKPVIEWVLRKGLLLECEDNVGKKQHANYFFKTFESEAEATTEYLKRFNEDKDEHENCMPSYDMFCDKIVQNKLGGTQTLGVYLLFNKIGCVNLLLNAKPEEDAGESPPTPQVTLDDKKISVPTVEEIQAKDKGEILKYRNKLAERIEELDIDGIINSLEARLKKEAQAYFLTRKELIFIEGHVNTAEKNRPDKIDNQVASKMTENILALTNLIRVFKKGIDEDTKSAQSMVTRFKPKLNKKGKEIRDPKTYELYTKYQNFATLFQKIATDSDSLIGRLADQATEMWKVKQLDKEVENMEDPPELTSQDYFVPIDGSIADDIIRINYNIHNAVKEYSISPPSIKGAKDYYQAFVSYVIDSMSKMSEIYWKAELMQHNRFEEKKQVEELRQKMRTIIREEVKSDILTELLNIVTLTMHTVDDDYDKLKKESYKLRGQVLELLNASDAEKKKNNKKK
ncbi:hypothetical protein GCK72_025809 [Caenorhabditis remanei]|uniref:CCDC93 N-terminal domain-containing protein n=1 Tax=Caenorhabditis remanei TaxID=31234 RepID=A0A6A5G3R8_CAERE|nr:hypothetical protein GCK72_025809 [Caenorhabditis remanei]KAF1749342.1 hypothetical protein GCK72_025809 [Caenorhabditis remanei]